MMRKTLIQLMLVVLLIAGSACEREDRRPGLDTYTEPAEEEKVEPIQPSIQLIAERIEDDRFTLKANTTEFMTVKSTVVLDGQIYSYVESPTDVESGYKDILVKINPKSLQTDILFTQEMADMNNEGYNSFLGNPGILGTLDDERFIFLEPEVVDHRTKYHLSVYSVKTGELERVRSSIWEVAKYDSIYQYRMSSDKSKVMMQSDEGNVWFYDLSGGEDYVHHNRFRVIPHSTMGAPSLFVSPDLERFAFDDESGNVTFYDAAGQGLNTVELPANSYTPSQKVNWNDSGTIAWISSSSAEELRIKAIDVDYLSIAPDHIDFYSRDGDPLRSIQASNGKWDSIEVLRWLDADRALIKEYAYDGTREIHLRETETSFHIYNVKTGKKEKFTGNHLTQPTYEDQQDQYIVLRNNKPLNQYVKRKPLVRSLDHANSRIGSFLYKGTDKAAIFRKAPDLPYGFFIPDFFEERKLEDGYGWGYGEGEEWNGISVYNGYSNIQGEFKHNEKSIYTEYVSSTRGTEATEDYYVIRDREHEIVVKLTYTDDEMDSVLHILQGILEEMRYVYPSESKLNQEEQA